ncbi:MAG: HNH endonuclease family protein [Stygiobacter sp.]|nr:MAG: HNH endonuclease family protein [Stygiobacter sp.]KAF0215643.1 MAG: HNH endonuclease family [Ignavibacteria bacterium]
MKYWIIKGSPYWNDWHSMLVPNKTDIWFTHRPPKNWCVNDTLIFWDSAPRLRICAIGKLNKTFVKVNTEGNTEYEVIYLTKYLNSPVTISELRKISVVREASFLKAGPATSVFPITNEQGQIILDILVERNTNLLDILKNELVNEDDELNTQSFLEVSEGNQKLVSHIYKERNQKIVKLKKDYVLRVLGKLECEACGFNFENQYGELGKDFCEVHHKKAVAEYEHGDITTLDDLSILCANCHRMIHKTSPLMDINDFRLVLTKQLNTI